MATVTKDRQNKLRIIGLFFCQNELKFEMELQDKSVVQNFEHIRFLFSGFVLIM